ncbi:MAG: PRC-barrel domain-containing protein [Nanoarchaeota archaeon]|nr:PRC-barrel domain-containing protein [Nanoarchaeota archaeon]
MKKMDFFVKSGAHYKDTYDLRELIGSRVVSKNGLVVGKIVEIRAIPGEFDIEGIVVRRGIFKSNLYLNVNYIHQITAEAVFLNIDPSIMLKGMKVLDSEGELIGKVYGVLRKGDLNDLDKIIVSSFWRRKVIIPVSAIRKIGESILLAQDYHVNKKYFWQKP